MSLVAPVKDGQIQTTSSASSLKEGTTKDASSVDKDQFLQMLVAEMKYQDPLQPTSNTEWISQYATFSELEQMQNMVESTESSRANELVGKTVIMKVKDGTGDVSQVQGRVDYVVYEDGDALLSIDESLYSIKDLYMTVDDTYLEAYDLGLEMADRLGKLPKVDDITLADQKEIEYLYKLYYEDMNDYQKSFVASDNKKLLDQYYEQLQNLLAAEQEEQEALEERARQAALDAEEAAKKAQEAADKAETAVDKVETAVQEVAGQTQTTEETVEQEQPEISEEALDQLTSDL
ncbi:MAG: flagellar hook capping FlgD N-terminal domain-containing protein [Lachnospiraceae bacterium]|nr:flagellar hook capping FlgD N-terminal domain-containing protein [Lachnospiraceae bacterium]